MYRRIFILFIFTYLSKNSVSQKRNECWKDNINTDKYFFKGKKNKSTKIWEVIKDTLKYTSTHENIFTPSHLNGLEKAKSLKYLSLAFSKLDSFPTQIFALNNLKVLNLTGYTWHNPIIKKTIIPGEIQKNKNLEIIILDCNKIDSLPDSFGNLTNLKELGLSNNYLKSIPDCIKNLKNLTVLDLSENYIKTVPEWLYSFYNLKILYIEGNELNQVDIDRLKEALYNVKIIF